MYRIRTSRSSHPVPFPTLDAAVEKLQSVLQAKYQCGARIAFNDQLVYEIREQPRLEIELMWIEDPSGLRILSEETTLDC
jgi:hypothetical protein